MVKRYSNIYDVSFMIMLVIVLGMIIYYMPSYYGNFREIFSFLLIFASMQLLRIAMNKRG